MIDTPFDSKIQVVQVSRKIVYGRHAIQKLPQVLQELRIKNIAIISGKTATKQIAEKEIMPLIENSGIVTNKEMQKVVDTNHYILDKPIIKDLISIANEIKKENQTILVCGGGSIIDYTKVIAHISDQQYISVPTSASHDGFSSPYLNYLLRQKLSVKKSKDKRLDYIPKPPIAIVGDTFLINKEPQKYFASGVGDILSKIVANLDWKLSHRITGEPFDEYAATFGLLSAEVVDQGLFLLKNGGELATRLVVKALGNSGVAMSIAGNSRPASGSEHLISHYIDVERQKLGMTKVIPHGMQTGLASIVMLYLHGNKRWRRTREILEAVKAPITLKDIGIDEDLFLKAMTNAHKLRPRYTILGKGLTKESALNAMNATEII